MRENNNYYPTKQNKTGLDIPEFLSARQEQDEAYIRNDMEQTPKIARGINEAVQEGAEINRNNMYHLKELDRATDAYTEEEAKVVIKRLVSNYPDLVLGEVASLIKDMQNLSSIILQNSRKFAEKRGEI